MNIRLSNYPIIQRAKISKYPSIRILNHLRYPTIHVSIDTWIYGYIQLSIYPFIQVSMDTWILMDKLWFFWLITKVLAHFGKFCWFFKYPKVPGYLWINYPLSKYPWYLTIHVSNYPSIHDINYPWYPTIQVSMIFKYPWYPTIRISEKSGIHSSLGTTIS